VKSFVIALFAATAFGQWNVGPVLFQPGPSGTFDETAVKDPSIVYAEGKWRLFYTARGRNEYTLGYAAAPTLKGLAKTQRFQLRQLRGVKQNYAAAPQVFFFRPQKKWYLIYQTTDANYQPVFSTTATIDDPNSWTPPKTLTEHTEAAKWIDFWVICDASNAYLFFTRSQKEVVAMQTSLAEFPSGWKDPRVVYAPVHEATHVYRVGKRYEMLVELIDGPLRKYALTTAPAPAGPWTLASEEFASGRQLRDAPGAVHWTDEVSHGELLRRGNDERMEVDAKSVSFLIQGMRKEQHQGEYPSLPWSLGIISK